MITNWHDDVIKWKHFPHYWSFVREIHRSPVNSPRKGQWRGALMFSLICALNKRLSKQSWGWWFETPSRSLWRHCNDLADGNLILLVPVDCAARPCYSFTTSDEIQFWTPLQWRHNERNGVSNHRRLHCLLSCCFRHRSKKTSKLRVTGLCERNSTVTGEFPAQKTSDAENVSIRWRHHAILADYNLINNSMTLGDTAVRSSYTAVIRPMAMHILLSRRKPTKFSPCGFFTPSIQTWWIVEIINAITKTQDT